MPAIIGISAVPAPVPTPGSGGTGPSWTGGGSSGPTSTGPGFGPVAVTWPGSGQSQTVREPARGYDEYRRLVDSLRGLPTPGISNTEWSLYLAKGTAFDGNVRTTLALGTRWCLANPTSSAPSPYTSLMLTNLAGSLWLTRIDVFDPAAGTEAMIWKSAEPPPLGIGTPGGGSQTGKIPVGSPTGTGPAVSGPVGPPPS